MTTTVPVTQAAAPSLTFSASTFAKLSPHPYLLAHLTQTPRAQPSSSQTTTSPSSPTGEETSTSPTRPNGRLTSEFRAPHVNMGSLTHAEGSAVVRCGDTTAVAGVRGEILLASDIAGYNVGGVGGDGNGIRSDIRRQTLIEDLDLLVPNVELSTGCSPRFLPGQPPSVLAQALSTRVHSLLLSSRMLDVADLEIWYTLPAELEAGDVVMEDKDEDEGEDEDGQGDDGGDDDGGGDKVAGGEEPTAKAVVKAYWTLYIDIVFISLDGNPFDAAWAATLAALRNVRLPRAHWDPDTEMVLCSHQLSESKSLNLRGLPVACTFVVFAAGTAAPGNPQVGEGKDGKRQWILADPDTFEEGLCDETVTLAVDCSRAPQRPERAQGTRILSISKAGGTGIGRVQVGQLVGMARERWSTWDMALRSASEGAM